MKRQLFTTICFICIVSFVTLSDDGVTNAMDFIPCNLHGAIQNYTSNTDVSLCLQAAIESAIISSRNLVIPAGQYIVNSTLIIDPAYFPHNSSSGSQGMLQISGVVGATKIICRNNIVALKIGTYDYDIHGIDPDGIYQLNHTAVKGLSFEFGGTVSTHAAIEVRRLYNGKIDDIFVDGFKNAISECPGTAGTRYNNIDCTSNDVALLRSSDGRVGSGTMNSYSNFYCKNFTTAGFLLTGAAFGDCMITNIIGWGKDTNSMAMVWLQGSANSIYASKITISNIDLDGSAKCAVRVDTASIVKISNITVNSGNSSEIIWNLSGSQANNRNYYLDSLATKDGVPVSDTNTANNAIIKYKITDETVNNTTAFKTDSHLSWSGLPANTTYLLHLQLYGKTGTTAQFKCRIEGAGVTTSYVGAGRYASQYGNLNELVYMIFAAGGDAQFTSINSSGFSITIDGVFKTGNSGGTLVVKWGQVTMETVNTTLYGQSGTIGYKQSYGYIQKIIQ